MTDQIDQNIFQFSLPVLSAAQPRIEWPGQKAFTQTSYLPARLEQQYGPTESESKNKIFWGDNLQVMRHLLRDYQGKIDLIYFDPPFDSKADYAKTISLKSPANSKSWAKASFSDKQYSDYWTKEDYLQFIYERLILSRELLSETGSIFLHCDWHQSHQLRMLLDQVFGPENFVNEIIWTYRTGGGSKRRFGRKHDTIFFYSKTARYQFYPQVEKSYLSHKYGFSNIKIYEDSTGRHYTLATMRDFWEIDALRGNQPETVGYPTQKPERLLERIINATTKPGDLVFDGFAGSGTTPVVAQKLGRHFLAADSNLGSIETIIRRLLQTTDQPHFSTYYLSNHRSENPSFRNHLEAKTAVFRTYQLKPLPTKPLFDGTWQGKPVKIMPLFTNVEESDLQQFLSSFPAQDLPKRIVFFCFSTSLPRRPKISLSTISTELIYPDIEVINLSTDPCFKSTLSDLQLDCQVLANQLVINGFSSPILEKQIADQIDSLTDWRQLVEAIMIEFQGDSAQKTVANKDVFQPNFYDFPNKNSLVSGCYPIPKGTSRIRLRITDLRNQSLLTEITIRPSILENKTK